MAAEKIAVPRSRPQASPPAAAGAFAAGAHCLSRAGPCPCCGDRLRKIGEDVTETLELVPR
ncbi:IS66 family transposase zinc-finger binding domain-containing protein [Bradyrhizobium sp. DOA9]|uniref:IS66 family transposase zinc-finger binding domain-containing protein n=1 Tax=Bradyrhizobium sp. DOA9 TaxID=1126627 RepID=UPI0012600D90